jgi:hypothetical protein
MQSWNASACQKVERTIPTFSEFFSRWREEFAERIANELMSADCVPRRLYARHKTHN